MYKKECFKTFFFFDIIYMVIIMDLLLIAIILFLPLLAQGKINSTYSKYSKVQNSINISGKEVARKILDKNGLKNVNINQIGGSLSDHYDPRGKSVNLSSKIYEENSISSVSVAAHECGHAIQDKEAYAFLRFRSAMVPTVNFTSRFATIFIFLGFILQYLNLIYIGIALLSVGLLFQLITLPVEFDASRRGKEELQKLGLISDGDIKGTKKVLNAAAFTYVAGFLASALQVLRLVLISRRN